MTKFVLITIFLIGAAGSIFALDVSSKLDFNTDEQSFDYSSNYSDPLLISEASDDYSQRDSRAAKGKIRISLDSPIFSIQPRKNPRNAPTPLNIIKNVYVVVNEQGITISGPGRIDCKENFCHMIITNTDMWGNIVSTVQLTVVAKMPRVKVDDVPIINGMRGVGYNNAQNPRSQYFVYKVPQTAFYQRAMKHPKPIQSTFSPNYGGWSPRIVSTSPVDDKIAPPLSQTNNNDGPI